MDNSIDVLLIAVGDNEEDKSLPLGVAFLGGQLRKAGFSYDIFDLSIYGWEQKNLRHLSAIISQKEPKLIGISSTSYYIDQVRELAEKIRNIDSSIVIAVGGYISLIEKILEKTGVDIVCLGEGDEIIVSIAKSIANNDRFIELVHKIPNIVWQDKNKKIYRNAEGRLISDLDGLAFPDFSKFDLNQYKPPKSLPMYSQRGCYNNCTFCDIIPFYQAKYIRRMSPARILSWIDENVENYGINRIGFVDDNFLNSRPFVEAFFSELANYNESITDQENRIKISFQARANEVIRFKDILIKFKDTINCVQIGTESFSQSQLDRWNKNITKLDNIDSIKILSENDINYVNYYLWLDSQTIAEELYENVETVLMLPPTPIHISDVKVPNYVYNYEVSAICDRLGNSEVEKIPELHAAEEFLNETNGLAKKISYIYISMKILLEENKTIDSQENFNRSADIFFQLAEQWMKRRLKLVPYIVENIRKYPLFRKRSYKKILSERLDEMNSKGEQIINPIKDKFDLDLNGLRNL